MIVAELDAILRAETGPLLRGLATADAAVAATKKYLESMEASAKAVSVALGQIKIDTSQSQATRAQAAVIQNAIDGIGSSATAAKAAVNGVGFQHGAVTDFVLKGETMRATLEAIKDEADEANRALDSLDIRQARDAAGRFAAGRVFVGGTPQSASSVTGVAAQYAQPDAAFLTDQRGAAFRQAMEARIANAMSPGELAARQYLRDRGLLGSLAASGALGVAAAERAGGGGGGALGLMGLLGFGRSGGIRVPVPFLGAGLGRNLTFGRGMAGFGTIAGLAGFGAERALTSTLGIGGSMVGGLAGGALLGMGALGTTAVGMGTDMAGIGQAAGDIKNTTQALDQLQKQIAIYGANSRQAALAQAQLNQTLADFNPVAKGAVLAAAQTVQQFKKMFDQATGMAEKTGAEIINQAMHVGEKFLPTIGRFATQNMSIIQQGLQPFFAWLQNSGKSGGLGIFTDLEKVFQRNLPTSIHALTQGFELLMKTIDVSAQHIGGFMKGLDRFFTRMNGPDFGHWSSEVNKLIGLFDTWLHLFTALGGAIVDVFRPAVGFGQQFAAGLTEIVDKVREWLSAAGTQDVLHNLFAAHLAQVKAIFSVIMGLLPLLESTLSAFLQVEGAVSRLIAGPLRVLAAIVRELTASNFANKMMGWALAIVAIIKVNTMLLSGMGALRVMLLGIGPAALMGAGTADAAVASVGETATVATGAVATLNAALGALIPVAGAAFAAVAAVNWMRGQAKHIVTGSAASGSMTLDNGNTYAIGRGGVAGMAGSAPLPVDVGYGIDRSNHGHIFTGPVHHAAIAYGNHSAAYWQNLARQRAAQFGTPSALPGGISAPGAGGGGGGSAAARAAARRLAPLGLGAQLTAGIHNALAAQERSILGIGAGGADATATVVHLRAQAAALGHTIAADAAKGINTTAVKAQLAKINEVLKRDFVPPDVRQAIATQFGTIGSTIKQAMQDALQIAQQQLQDAQQAVSGAFQQINQGIDQQFQRNVQQHLATMQIMVNSPFGKFLFGGNITNTPAQQQLDALQQSHTQQQLQQALTDAQNAVKKAQSPGIIYDAAIGPPTDAAAYSSMGANTQALIDAQRQLADAQYNIQVNSLQTQAQAQQDAATTQLRAAQDAYQQQQDLVQQAMDQQVAAVEQGMQDQTITVDEGWKKIKGILGSNNVDIYNLSYSIGGKIYTGLNDAITKLVNPLLKSLMESIKAVIDLGGGTTAQQQAAAGFNAQALGAAQAALANGTGSIAAVQAAAAAAGYTQSLGALGRAGIIPGYASGGIVKAKPGGTLVRVGEGGRDEAITPVGSGTGGGGGPIHIHVYLDGNEVGGAVSDVVYEDFALRALRQGGKLFNGVVST